MNQDDVRAAVDEAITYVRRWYDESIFPPRPKGPHTEVYDGEAAAVARLTCDNIRREFEERLAEHNDCSTEALPAYRVDAPAVRGED